MRAALCWALGHEPIDCDQSVAVWSCRCRRYCVTAETLQRQFPERWPNLWSGFVRVVFGYIWPRPMPRPPL